MRTRNYYYECLLSCFLNMKRRGMTKYSNFIDIFYNEPEFMLALKKLSEDGFTILIKDGVFEISLSNSEFDKIYSSLIHRIVLSARKGDYSVKINLVDFKKVIPYIKACLIEDGFIVSSIKDGFFVRWDDNRGRLACKMHKLASVKKVNMEIEKILDLYKESNENDVLGIIFYSPEILNNEYCKKLFIDRLNMYSFTVDELLDKKLFIKKIIY